MVVHALGDQRAAGHEPECADEVVELKRARELAAGV
jgi:hypothetical protein